MVGNVPVRRLSSDEWKYQSDGVSGISDDIMFSSSNRTYKTMEVFILLSHCDAMSTLIDKRARHRITAMK